MCRAHSIQRNGVLNKIAENGNVIGFGFSNGRGFESVGIAKASTFSGFCAEHDQHIFKPIDLNPYYIGNSEQEFLFAYRALAKQYYTDINMLGVELERMRDPSQNLKGLNFDQSQAMRIFEFLEQRIDQLNLDIKDHKQNQEAMNYFLANKRFDRLITHWLVFEEEYGVAVSSSFAIYKDINGIIVNDIYKLKTYIPSIFLTVFPQDGKTYILISYLHKSRHIYNFIKSQVVNKSIQEQKIIISNIILANVENFFISPRLFNTLGEDRQRKIFDAYSSTVRWKPALLFDVRLNLFIDA
jgi:hypothetical protein